MSKTKECQVSRQKHKSICMKIYLYFVVFQLLHIFKKLGKERLENKEILDKYFRGMIFLHHIVKPWSWEMLLLNVNIAFL